MQQNGLLLACLHSHIISLIGHKKEFKRQHLTCRNLSLLITVTTHLTGVDVVKFRHDVGVFFVQADGSFFTPDHDGFLTYHQFLTHRSSQGTVVYYKRLSHMGGSQPSPSRECVDNISPPPPFPPPQFHPGLRN